MKKIFKKILGDPEAKTLKRMKKRVSVINGLENKYKKMSDAKLKDQIKVLKKRLEKESLDDILPDTFAIVREAAQRTLGQRHYDVQLIGGMVLHEGKVAEMRTGEGKTLVATLPLVLNALTGKGAHLVTVNDYLAQRDAGWNGQIYNSLGLSTAVIIPDASYIYDPKFNNEDHDDPRMKHLKPCTRQEAYAADITVGTNNEYGFDYLRDNMVREEDQLRQRELNFAIVDEVDSILIDEARTPLIISAAAAASASAYEQFAKVAARLEPKHYEKDEKRKSVILTDEGVEQVEKILSIDNLYATQNIRVIYHLEQALRAQVLFTKDKDYVVTTDGEVVIVDTFTGRLLKGRRYNEGLHQAIEAKEGTEIQQESMTLATISFQNYFRLYDKLSGMTGTAKTEEEEFHQIYTLEVVSIPTNKPLVRKDHPDRIYKNEAAKFRAIAREVQERQEKGQPVLIGSASIEKNEELSRLLSKAGVAHELLNAKNNEREAKIVSRAGEKRAVTLATNIAGRGTDIVLGDGVVGLGGLFVLGSERHESRRIDDQLRGRAGRQGDPGESQFFVSTDDDLMRIFGGEKIGNFMNKLGADEDTPIQNRFISKSLESAQKKVEGFNFDSRKNVVDYDDVMNRHRKAIYAMRKEVLKAKDISPRIKQFIEEEVGLLANSGNKTDENFDESIKHVFPFSEDTLDALFESDVEMFSKELKQKALDLYDSREAAFTTEIMRMAESEIFLQILDNLWMRHLEDMDHMKQGIHWISVGQRDPLVEYRRQSQVMFQSMQNNMRHDIIRSLYHAEPVAEELEKPKDTELTRAAKRSVENADKILKADEFNEADFKITRRRKVAPGGQSEVVSGAASKTKKQNTKKFKKKTRKQERKRRAKGRRK
ncbi:MAG: preprotein translocase subunit SecA [bacterium]|nr:preprotein translocase subunit SecA [bacterium]